MKRREFVGAALVGGAGLIGAPRSVQAADLRSMAEALQKQADTVRAAIDEWDRYPGVSAYASKCIADVPCGASMRLFGADDRMDVPLELGDGREEVLAKLNAAVDKVPAQDLAFLARATEAEHVFNRLDEVRTTRRYSNATYDRYRARLWWAGDDKPDQYVDLDVHDNAETMLAKMLAAHRERIG